MIDGHCHLDKSEGTVERAFETLYNEAVSSGVTKVILLNVEEIAFGNESVLKAAQKYGDFFAVFPSLIPHQGLKALTALRKLKDLGAEGLKLHPRIHDYSILDKDTVSLVQEAGRLKLPVMVDCFPDGKNIFLKNLPESFGYLAHQAPETRIAIGHSGGHHILDALMIAKHFKNLYLDLSFSLLYYRGTRVMDDMAYTIRNIKGQRTFWGGDFPDRPYKETVEASLEELKAMKFSDKMMDDILVNNVQQFLGDNV